MYLLSGAAARVIGAGGRSSISLSSLHHYSW